MVLSVALSVFLYALSNEEIRHENQSGEGIRNAHYLENGAVDCEVLFEGETEFALYTAIQDDMAPTGQHVWQELQSGKWAKSPRSLSRLNLLQRQRMPRWGN